MDSYLKELLCLEAIFKNIEYMLYSLTNVLQVMKTHLSLDNHAVHLLPA